jgi:1-acyl-sn-glycerol-3-phosphate acyltransferase
MKYLYRIYQLFIAAPIMLVATILTAFTVTIGCTLGNGHFWGYYPAKWWSWLMIRMFLLPVTVEGRENINRDQSYVFVANHQGAFDIFLIYGFLNHQFKWMMKRQLAKMPFIGFACAASHQIFVDRSKPSKIKETITKALKILQGGMSVTAFPEGSRTFTGHMGIFRRGAFMLADDLQLPVVPLTINGSYNVKPRMRDIYWIFWHPLKLTIHTPIYPNGSGSSDINYLRDKSYEAVMSSLDVEYQGYVENKDQ